MNAIDIVKEQAAAYDAGKSYAVVTIVHSDGSTPRSSGKMIVYADGTTRGTIGGGAVELIAIKDAIKCIENGANAYKEYDLTSPSSNTGMTCGGDMSVLIEAFIAKPLLVMIGAGHVGAAVMHIAEFIGYDTLLIDDRADEQIADKIASAGHFVRVKDFEVEIKAMNIPDGAYYVIATHGHAHDGAALAGVLDKNAAYIGMIGSSKKIEVTVQPLAQDELDTAAAFMKKVCSEEVYWDGIKKANSAKDNITGDMWSFIEIVPDGDGYKFIRTADDAKGVGVKADSIDGWYASEKYRCFRSSKDTVIKHENLLLTKPQYNTSVTIDSVLSYSEYSKYYEKFKDNADYTQFAKFYKQPISIVVKVIGTEGIDNPNTETISVTVNMDGNAINSEFVDFSYTYICNSEDYKTGMDAIVAAITESGYTYTGNGSYLNSVTSPDGVTLGLADEKYGPWSGWMFTVNGSSPMLDETTQARLDQYILKKGDIIRFYYVECPTEARHHIRGTDDKTKCSVCGKVMPLLYGDVNGDGEVTSTDAGIVILYLKGKTELTAEQLLAADVNGDGQVTSSDAGNIILYCKGKISSFPASAN